MSKMARELAYAEIERLRKELADEQSAHKTTYQMLDNLRQINKALELREIIWRHKFGDLKQIKHFSNYDYEIKKATESVEAFINGPQRERDHFVS